MSNLKTDIAANKIWKSFYSNFKILKW
jgi:hypothetical protein